MNKCAFLSMDSLEDFVCYDDLLIEPFNIAGWRVESVSWRNDKVDWNNFDVVIIRSCWDYQDDSDKFLDVLNKIENSSALLTNSLAVVKWNIDKRYLLDLQKNGIDIVPSKVFDKYSVSELEKSFNDFNCDELIIKPTISANADNTFRINKENQNGLKDRLAVTFNSLPHIIQPFIHSIIYEGEYSLFYFGGEFSHCILKTPKQNDFRVQEEHGGLLKSVETDEHICKAADKIVNVLPPDLLYARIDLVKSNNDFLLMEVELIEPSLYFNMDKNSAQKFVDSFIKWYD